MASSVLNPEAERYFEQRSAHDEVGVMLLESLKRLGEYEVRGNLPVFRSPYAVTKNIVFCGAAGMRTVLYRLRPADVETALQTGASRTPEIGPEWVSIEVFRANFPKPDLDFWSLRAYDFARTGA